VKIKKSEKVEKLSLKVLSIIVLFAVLILHAGYVWGLTNNLQNFFELKLIFGTLSVVLPVFSFLFLVPYLPAPILFIIDAAFTVHASMSYKNWKLAKKHEKRSLNRLLLGILTLFISIIFFLKSV
jgi:hypothetical protein